MYLKRSVMGCDADAMCVDLLQIIVQHVAGSDGELDETIVAKSHYKRPSFNDGPKVKYGSFVLSGDLKIC